MPRAAPDAIADVARDRGAHGDGRLRAEHCFLEVEVDDDLEVCAAWRAAWAATASAEPAAEERIEEVAEPTEVRVAGGGTDAFGTEPVVALAPLRIREHFVRDARPP